MSPAEQARAMGLKVGDTIEGTDVCMDGWWITSRLTLLWLGEELAVWRETYRSADNPEWSDPEESASCDLDYKEWKKISGAPESQVECVARAICAACGEGPHDPGDGTAGSVYRWEDYEQAAQAAIAAMVNP